MQREDVRDQVATLLWNAQEDKVPVGPIRSIIGVEDIALAYDIQAVNIGKRKSQGAKVTGKKIGLTSFVVQEQLGVDQPDYGILLDTMSVKNGRLPVEEVMQGKAECEIAFVMGESLHGDVTMDQLKYAIDFACVSIEIVGSRIENWDIKITDTIADNASASHYILGDNRVQVSDVDLVNCSMQMHKNGVLASEGVGKACMGNPLEAALWLAKTMSLKGNPIEKGEIILSGALGPMVPIEKGDELNATINGFGAVNLDII